MINVAIITGGPSAERGIALKSAGLVEDYLDKKKYSQKTILIEANGWFEKETNTKLDLNDFSLTINGVKEHFNFAFLMIHGTPAEDGKIQGYLEMMDIPHSTCNTLTSALTFNKQVCKDYLRNFGVSQAESIIINDAGELEKAKKIPLPVFVKPNKNGSSYGVSRVMDPMKLEAAIQKAFEFDNEVMVESYLEGREFGCGVIKAKDKIHAFPITELIPDEGHEFFDYEAKYEGKSQEITPADLSETETLDIQNISTKLYQLLGCKGIVRFDFILKENTFFLLEANTIPGMSPASIVPQQARAYGWSIEQLLDVVVENCIGQ